MIVVEGIDGSGKSSHSTVTSGWLERRGYRVELMPFHRYLFVERLSSISSAVRGGSGSNSSSDQSYSGGPVSSKRRHPLRPVLSLADNLLLQISTSLGCRIEGTVGSFMALTRGRSRPSRRKRHHVVGPRSGSKRRCSARKDRT